MDFDDTTREPRDLLRQVRNQDVISTLLIPTNSSLDKTDMRLDLLSNRRPTLPYFFREKDIERKRGPLKES